MGFCLFALFIFPLTHQKQRKGGIVLPIYPCLWFSKLPFLRKPKIRGEVSEICFLRFFTRCEFKAVERMKEEKKVFWGGGDF